MPGFESVAPEGAAILATFEIAPASAAIVLAVRELVPMALLEMVAFTENVTLPPGGSVGITIPVPCIRATVVFGTDGHAAPPLAPLQLTPVTVRFATAGSVKTAPSPDDGPELLTTMV